MEKKPQAPGLTWPHGRGPIWRASRAAINSGFKPKWANLSYFANDPAALEARCYRLTAEMNDWLAGRRGTGKRVFDGTVHSLMILYQTEEMSPYHDLEPSSRHPYNVYLRMIIETVGARRIDALDGDDLRRWHREWIAPLVQDGKRRLAAGRMAMIVFKTALTYGITRKWPGCAELRAILKDIDFPLPRPRTQAPTAAQIIAARRAAHDLGHSRAALAYALQFEGGMRQWDVIGKWVPLSDKRASLVISGQYKWLGPMWAIIDEHLILRYTPSKTQFTSGAMVTHDLTHFPMVMDELGQVPLEARRGPLIVGPHGLPYQGFAWRRLWASVRQRIGISADVWNRDMRAAAVTEAREAGAANADVAKSIGDTERTTAEVYDRARLAAARRTAQARNTYRNRDGNGE